MESKKYWVCLPNDWEDDQGMYCAYDSNSLGDALRWFNECTTIGKELCEYVSLPKPHGKRGSTSYLVTLLK